MAKAKRKSSGKSRNQENVISLEEQRGPKIKRTRKREVHMIPRNTVQEDYIAKLEDDDNKVVFALGPAGTGKTLLATLLAVRELLAGNIERVIITRPATEVDGEKFGFLPGDLNQKMEPWTRPVMDCFEEYFSPPEIAAMIEDGVIEIAPLAFMRGRTFKNSLIILDEAQNCSINQLKMALTRIGEDSRMVLTGDLRQTDVVKDNGLEDILERVSKFGAKRIAVTKFGREHVERSEIVSEILGLYGED